MPDKKYQCQYCFLNFYFPIQLASHINKCHKDSINRIYKCSVLKCEKKFGSKSTCDDHSARHWQKLCKEYKKLPTQCQVHVLKKCNCFLKKYGNFFQGP